MTSNANNLQSILASNNRLTNIYRTVVLEKIDARITELQQAINDLEKMKADVINNPILNGDNNIHHTVNDGMQN